MIKQFIYILQNYVKRPAVAKEMLIVIAALFNEDELKELPFELSNEIELQEAGHVTEEALELLDDESKKNKFRIAAARSRIDTCNKILRFFKCHKTEQELNTFLLDNTSGILLDALSDSILFRKKEMFHTILTAIRDGLGYGYLERTLQADITHFVEQHKLKRKKRTNVTVFTSCNDKETFSALIDAFVGNLNGIDGELILKRHEFLYELFLQNKESLETLKCLEEKCFRSIVTKERFKSFLERVLTIDICLGLDLLSDHILKWLDRNQAEELVTVLITANRSINGEDTSYWCQALSQPQITFLPLLCECISKTLGDQVLTKNLLLYDNGKALAHSLLTNYRSDHIEVILNCLSTEWRNELGRR